METKKGGLLNREALLKKEKLQIIKVNLESGDFVFVRQMTGHERDIFEQSLMRKKTNAKGDVIGFETVLEDFRAKLAVQTVCDEAGQPLLLPDDYSVLSQMMSAKTLEAIVNVAQELNAITEKDKEELVKNSAAGQPGNSTSDSVEK